MNEHQKIANQETKVPTGPSMNDRDFINDMLATEKYMTGAYSIALNEASHEDLYKDIQSIFNETQNAQRRLYNTMFKHGWYKLETAEAQKLQQIHQQFSNYFKEQSPYGNLTQ
ncbi:spore coat protein [Metabacillus malikii]|uniref:Spore coat protein CotF n=1 Tax=Metabacillus malikii TaxID=1504265 RepID=A0ABT9ZEH8_9BACI|nr:spore coat protein [Metabacillus malikii]MDQ0229670.1 spore coat protein CotF [Metabacillus malikii]